jgi:hypothetical protein
MSGEYQELLFDFFNILRDVVNDFDGDFLIGLGI